MGIMVTEQERMNNPLVVIGLCKEKVGRLLMLDGDVRELVMPTLDDENFTIEQNWFGCKIEDDKSGEIKNINLLGHCKDTPYFDETITDTRAMIWMESFINFYRRPILKLTLAINVVCHKDIIPFSYEEELYWHKKGYTGNRVDVICQAIYKVLTNPSINKEFGIGTMDLDTEVAQLSAFKPNYSFYGRTMSFLIDEIHLSQRDRRC